MIVIATGPRSNGTSLLYRILCTGVQLPLHIPAFPPWFKDRDWSKDFPTALFVVSLRGVEAAAQSALRRGFSEDLPAALAEQLQARRYLAQFVGLDRMYMVCYEDMTAEPEATVADITTFLRSHGYDGAPLSLPEPIRRAA